VTVSYLVVDAQTIEAQLRDAARCRAFVGWTSDGLASCGSRRGPWPAASLGTRAIDAPARARARGHGRGRRLVHAASTIEGVRRFSRRGRHARTARSSYAASRGAVARSWTITALVGVVSLRWATPVREPRHPLETFCREDELIARPRDEPAAAAWLGCTRARATVSWWTASTTPGRAHAASARRPHRRRDGVRVATQEDLRRLCAAGRRHHRVPCAAATPSA